MPIDRFYTPESLQENATLSLEGPEFHHLTHVIRSKPGDHIELVNGQGDLATAQIIHANRHSAELTIKECAHFPKPPFECILFQAIARQNRLENIIEKATELGATEIHLFPGMKSEKKLPRLDRLQTIMVSALKQSGRLHLPSLDLIDPILNWRPFSYPVYYGKVNPNAPSFSTQWENSHRAGMVIGPESGFSDQEIQLLDKLGTSGVQLSSHILRTDTAAILGVGLMTHLLTLRSLLLFNLSFGFILLMCREVLA